MLLISLMEMLPAALAAEGMSPVLGYGMFIFGLLGYFGLDRMLPAAGIMLLISLMEMLPAALAAEGMSPVLGYGMFIFGLLGYFGLDRMLPDAHPQDLMQKSVQPLPKSIKRTAILLTLGISLHNFPEGIATFVTASSNAKIGAAVAKIDQAHSHSAHSRHQSA